MTSRPPRFRFLFFITIVLAINTFASAFLGFFILKGFEFSTRVTALIFTGIWSGIPFFILAEFVRRVKGWSLPYVVGAVLLGCLSIAVGMACLGYIGIFLGIPARVAVKAFFVATPLLSFFGIMIHLKGPKIVAIDLSREPVFSSIKTPLTFVHITDIHLTSHTRNRWIKNLVRLVNQQSPDFIVFTGDLIDVDPALIPEKIKMLSQLEAKHGKFAVSGNHDFMTGILKFYRVCEVLGFQVLDHHHVDKAGLTFAGVPDEMASSFGEKKPSIAYLKTIHTRHPMIFLKHRPTLFKQAVLAGASLQLSGHSHNGQLPPWGLLVALRYSKYAYGLNRLKNSFIYTSSGTGIWGPPMRLFGRSEIGVFHI
jgi:predicted MPP superfamily phosphohydrolase